jgi:predicted MFS family arabinose efflux permease
METASLTTSRPAPKIIFVVSLLVAVFAAAVIDVVIPINTLDIAHTFNILPGTVGQLDSIIAIASVAAALMLGAFGAKFKYKSLVMIGVLFIAIYDLGLFLAPTFPIVQLIVPLNGIGSVMIVVTAQTFIGNSFTLDKKAKAIGWVVAAGAFANAVGAPIIGFTTGIEGWRSVLIWFMFPVAVVSLIFVFLVFPFNLPEPQLNAKKEPFMRGFKQVLTNKSAVACLAAAFFGNAFWFGGAFFEVTLLRQMFSVSPGLAALIGPLAGIMFVSAGAIVGGNVVNRVGRKRLTVVAIFSAGLFVLLSYFMPDLWVRQALRWIASALFGVMVAAASNLMLEQVPRFRGTAMSLSSAFGGVGTAVGVFVAGAVLNLYLGATIGFQAVGLTVSAFAFAGTLIILFFARDPIRNPALEPKPL